jgi:hypothetical protein
MIFRNSAVVLSRCLISMDSKERMACNALTKVIFTSLIPELVFPPFDAVYSFDDQKNELKDTMLDPNQFFITKEPGTGNDLVFQRFFDCHNCSFPINHYSPRWSFLKDHTLVDLCNDCAKMESDDKLIPICPTHEAKEKVKEKLFKSIKAMFETD